MKKIFSAIGKEFVYGGHLLSLGASAIVLSTLILQKLPLSFHIFFIPYAISQVVYSYNHIYELKFEKSSNRERSEYLESQRVVSYGLLTVYSLIVFFFSIYSNVQTSLFSCFIIFGGILYTTNLKSLNIPGFKNVYVSFFWAVLIFLPPLYLHVAIDSYYLYLFLFIFLRFLVSTVFFDLKDIEDDRARGIRTLPVVFGKRNAIGSLHIINIASILPLIVGLWLEVFPVSILFLSLSVLYGFSYLVYGTLLEGKKLRKISYLVVDGEYLVWLFLIVLGEIII